MTKQFPKSFPNAAERAFLDVLFCDDTVFDERYVEWKNKTVLAEVDYATSRLLPLLYRRLRGGSHQGEPTTLILKGVYKSAWVKNQRLLEALTGVIDLLTAQGIDVLVLKGIPLLLTVYKDMGARFMGDADILIEPRHIRLMLRCLLAAGWKIRSPHFPVYDRFSDESLARVNKEVTLVNDQGIEVDIHWSLFDVTVRPQEEWRFADLWDQSVEISHKGGVYRTLSAEDLLLHSIVHGAEGNPHRTLRWVTDAGAIIQTKPIHWETLIQRAQARCRGVELAMALGFLHTYQYAPIPATVLAMAAALPVSAKERRTYLARANAPLAWWGSFPRLWAIYWKYEVRARFPLSVVEGIHYLALAWGFERGRDLIPFIWSKYKRRFFNKTSSSR